MQLNDILCLQDGRKGTVVKTTPNYVTVALCHPITKRLTRTNILRIDIAFDGVCWYVI